MDVSCVPLLSKFLSNKVAVCVYLLTNFRIEVPMEDESPQMVQEQRKRLIGERDWPTRHSGDVIVHSASRHGLDILKPDCPFEGASIRIRRKIKKGGILESGASDFEYVRMFIFEREQRSTEENVLGVQGICPFRPNRPNDDLRAFFPLADVQVFVFSEIKFRDREV